MVIGYIRVSTEQQDVRNQQHEILEYANQHKLHVNRFVKREISSRKDLKARGIEELLGSLKKGDTLVVPELSRLGRSIIEVISVINELVKQKIRFISIKQHLDIKGNHDVQSKVMVTIFSLLAELERDLISERTKKALAAKRAEGVALGRPPPAASARASSTASCPKLSTCSGTGRAAVSWRGASRCHGPRS